MDVIGTIGGDMDYWRRQIENYKRDANESDRVVCPQCGVTDLEVFWQDPPSGTGGRMTLHCTSCGHRWVHFNDYA